MPLPEPVRQLIARARARSMEPAGHKPASGKASATYSQIARDS